MAVGVGTIVPVPDGVIFVIGVVCPAGVSVVGNAVCAEIIEVASDSPIETGLAKGFVNNKTMLVTIAIRTRRIIPHFFDINVLRVD